MAIMRIDEHIDIFPEKGHHDVRVDIYIYISNLTNKFI